MKINNFGFCPYRIQLDLDASGFQAGCKLRIGIEALCYTQDVKPLINFSESENYQCPFLKINISKKTYGEVFRLIEPILQIQDEESTGINIWPIVAGISDSKHEALTEKGKELQILGQKIRNELHEIVFDLS